MTLEQVYQKEYGSVPSSLPAPTLISPANNSVISTTTPILTWTAVSGADYYTVAVMKGSVINPDNLVWWADKSYSNSISVPSGYLVSGETYTWVVAAHNSSGYGAGSDAWHFSIAQAQLTAPALVSPDDEESFIPSLDNYAITFNWLPVPGASSYTLWIGSGLSGAESTNVYKKSTSGTSLTISTSTLPSGQIYTWAVGVTDGAGNVVWSVDRHFSIVKENAISLITPYNGGTTYTGLLSWTSYVGADEYFVLVADEYNNVVYSNITTITMDVIPSYKLIWGSKYHWMVAAVKGKYSISCSNIGVFYYGY
jgi:hypothetical protein